MTFIRKVICGISGGVDSAVSALLLKRKGYNVHGLFMTNWDKANETGICSADKDREDAMFVCSHLNIPFHEVNFVKEYWNNVFSDMLQEYQEGRTPNPDVLCNRHIKFGAFFDHATKNLGADAVATGHYARNSYGTFLEDRSLQEGARLLMAKDAWKDQTLFLCQIKQEALQSTMFPVGGLQKEVVKTIAREAGLDKIAKRKESSGICFVGPKNFAKFIEQYIEPKPGNFVDMETGKVVGCHKGIHYWTVGQRSLIPGLGKGGAYYIAKIDPKNQDVYVVQGRRHPALFSHSFYTSAPTWIFRAPEDLYKYGNVQCQFKFQHPHPFLDCILELQDSQLKIELEKPLRALTPGQYAGFYLGEELLGSAQIIRVGPTLYEDNRLDNLQLLASQELTGSLGR